MKTIKFLTGMSLFLIFMFSATQSLNAQPCPKQAADDSTRCGHGIKIIEQHGDSVIIYISKKDVHHKFEEGCFWKKGKKKFNGHWAGVELGFNSYVDQDFSMNMPQGSRYLDIDFSRSLQFTINPFELNLNLAKNKFGLVSGLGLTINNYFFENRNYYFVGDEPAINAYAITDRDGMKVDLQKSKMVITWLTLPVLFEYQTNPGMKMNSFHVAVGAVGSVRLGQYTKQYYPAINTTFYLNDETGHVVGSFSSASFKTKDHSQYHLNPFRVDGTLRVGWSFLNFWANYSFTTLFKNNEGPDLYPFSVGITLAGW